MTEKTEFDFHYEPADFFEAPVALALKHGNLSAENGKALYVLSIPVDPLPEGLREEVRGEVERVFKLRQMLVRRPFEVQGPNLTQYSQGGGGRTIYVGTAETLCMAGTVDVVVKNAAGIVTHDSRAERIAAHNAFITSLLPKLGDGVLLAMVNSFCKATEDLDNELVHLFEVRDAAESLFGGPMAARAALTVPRRDWDDLGRIACDEPLRQGRHRGIHATRLRDATPEELERARSVARKIIEAYAARV